MTAKLIASTKEYSLVVAAQPPQCLALQLVIDPEDLHSRRARQVIEESNRGCVARAAAHERPRLAANMVRGQHRLIGARSQECGRDAVMCVAAHAQRDPGRRVEEDHRG